MNTEEKYGATIKKIVWVLLPIPLIIGTIGYYISGMSLLDSLYFGIRLYGLEWESDVKNIYVEAARWTAPFLTAAGFVTIISSVYSFVHKRMVILFYKNAVAVYTNSARGELVCSNMKGSILCSKTPLKRVKNHIILFDTDEENILFYRTHKDFFQNKKKRRTVYLCLNETDSCLLKPDMDNVCIFNAYDMIARDLWKSIKLWNCEKREDVQKVALLGFDSLGQRILRYGLQMNIYAENQCVEYHILGESSLYEAANRHFQPFNGDKLFFHGEVGEDKWKLLRDADYVIVAQDATIELLQGLFYNCEKAKIYYYNPAGEQISEYLNTDRLVAYGEDELIFTTENVRTDKLYERAQDVNYQYLVSTQQEGIKSKEEEWRALDGFTKGSNISSCDYSEVVLELEAFSQKNGFEITLEEYARFEHIRWSRYHLLNGWKYGVPEGGKNKDKERRIHTCLIPYEELSETEKEKDRQNIRNILIDKK